MIDIKTVEKTAHTLMTKAGIEIPDDYLTGIKEMANAEEGDLSSFVLQAMLENWEAAKEDRRPMCADTGLPRYYVKVGNEAKIDGGFVRELAHSELDHAMVRSVHEIARVAGLETIAESVESVEVLIRLKQIGIDYLQGHIIHNPVRLRELVLPGNEIETPV